MSERRRTVFIRFVFAVMWLAACVPGLSEPVRGSGDGLTAVLTTDPPVIALGRAKVTLELRDGGQPLDDAEVRVLVRMPSMDMGEREEIARPVAGAPGRYAAPAVFSMAGQYVADVTVKKGGAQRKLQLKLSTGMDTRERGGSGRILPITVFAVLVALVGYTLIRMRQTGQRVELRGLAKPQVIMGIVLLAVALAVAMYAVRNWRRPGAMTPIEAQAMEMATPPPPGVAPVVVAPVDRGPVDQSVTYIGQVAGWVDQDIYPRVQGWIVAMPVYVGTRVRAGDLLARLDTSEIRPVLDERSAAVRSAQEAERMAAAEESRASADLTRAHAAVRAEEASVEVSRAELAAAEADLTDALENLNVAQLMVGEASAALTSAEEGHVYRQAELKRALSLRDRGAVSVQEMERARADASAASASRDQARLRVSQSEARVRSAAARVRSAEAAVAAARQRSTAAQERLAAMRAELAAGRAMVTAAMSRRRMSGAEVAQAGAMLRAASTSERYAEIRATADGVITERLMAPGVLAIPGRAILRMSQTRPVRLQASVSESDLARIRVGAPVEVWRLDAPDRRIKTYVSSVAPLVNSGTRTGLVEAIWRDQEPAFAVGEAVTMRVAVASRASALRVPTAAVREQVGGGASVEGRTVTHYVWVARANGPITVARRVAFEPGLKSDRYVEVVSGLTEDDQVIIEGADSLRDGDEIALEGPRPRGHAHQHEAAYICTMCPEVRSDTPGKCPRCGMTLVREASAQ